MSNRKVQVGDHVVYDDGEVAPVVAVWNDRNFRVRTKRWDVCTESLKEDGGDVELAVVDQPTLKLQQALEDVRKARAAEHMARKNVATIKGQVKDVESVYVEAQKQRQKAVERLLAEIDEAGA